MIICDTNSLKSLLHYENQLAVARNFSLRWLMVENSRQKNWETGYSKTKRPHKSNAWKCEYTRWKEYPFIKRINGTTSNELKIRIKSNKMIQLRTRKSL